MKLKFLVPLLLLSLGIAFQGKLKINYVSPLSSVALFSTKEYKVYNTSPFLSRKHFLLQSIIGSSALLFQSGAANSDEGLQSYLYTILRVREATQQETRLISSGKFKDVQRANVKLAVNFMLENYRFSDNLLRASALLDGNKRILATEVGQSAAQSLYTILEYFDSADVQNIKVGQMKDDFGGAKEKFVLKGLET